MIVSVGTHATLSRWQKNAVVTQDVCLELEVQGKLLSSFGQPWVGEVGLESLPFLPHPSLLCECCIVMATARRLEAPVLNNEQIGPALSPSNPQCILSLNPPSYFLHPKCRDDCFQQTGQIQEAELKK